VSWLSLLLLGSTAATDEARAGAWTRELGHFYAKGGLGVYTANRFVAPGTSEPVDVNFWSQQYQVYGEAGVLPGYKGQISVFAPLGVGTLRGEVMDPFGVVPLRATTVRLGDLRVAGQIALHPEVPLAAAVEAKIPMYGNGNVGQDYPIYQDIFPKPGDGQVDLIGWLYAGASPLPKTFAEVGVGYLHRTEAFVGWDEASRRRALNADPQSTARSELTFVDGVVFNVKGGRQLGPVLPIVGVEGQLALAESQWTRQFVAPYALALIDVAEGLAIEPSVKWEAWARSASQGVAGSLGVSYRR
jgi:hypothetical protein